MITFPKEFVATKYPGYFWNIADKQLYSIKVTGVLRPLKRCKPCFYNHGFDGYQISVNGRKRYLHTEYLSKLTPKREKIPVYDATQLQLF